MRIYCKYRALWNTCVYAVCVTVVYVMYHVATIVSIDQRKQLDGIFYTGLDLPATLTTQHKMLSGGDSFDNKDNQKILKENVSTPAPITLSVEDMFYRKQAHVVNLFDNSIIVNQPTICTDGEDNPRFLIVVLSAARDGDRRDAIRDTWGRSHPAVRVVFLLGHDAKRFVIRNVELESSKQNDLIQYNISEGYQNLVEKSSLALKWAIQFCRNAQFVLKTDDDMLLHVPHLVKLLSHFNKTTRVLGGACVRGSTVYRTGRWKLTKEQYPFRRLPHYCSGSAYFLSMDAAMIIYETARYVPTIPIEDVYITGIVSRVAGLKPDGIPGFPLWTTRYREPCVFVKDQQYGAHGLPPKRMRTAWGDILNAKC